MKRIIYILIIMFSVGFISKINAYTEYKIGTQVEYNNVNYRVIKNSDTNSSSVSLLKEEPLTVDEVNKYGVGHINKYGDEPNVINDMNGYGGVAFYTSETCRYTDTSSIYDGCTSNYDSSDIKYIVDAWAQGETNLNDLVSDEHGYKARLIMLSDLDNLGYVVGNVTPSDIGYVPTENVPSWMYNINYQYWTMSPQWDSSTSICSIFDDGTINYKYIFDSVYDNEYTVRPVITLSKTALGDREENIDNNTDNDNTTNNDNETNESYNVPDTLKVVSIVLLILGVGLVLISIILLVNNKKVNDK